MIFIAHRGNVYGPSGGMENTPALIEDALHLGFQVEVDVWLHKADLYLGHDEPTQLLPDELLSDGRVWVHCKNIQAFNFLNAYKSYNSVKYFWHENDSYALTSNRLIWTYPGKELGSHSSIAVLPELVGSWEGLWNCYGICSDLVNDYRKIYEQSRNIN